MTALTDTLRERLSRRGRRAQADCGALGTVTVEALSPRECAALGMRDGGRGLLYAACRELQRSGEALRREGRLFTPEEVTQYVSDEEARQAAQVILELSGVTGADKTDLSGQPDGSAGPDSPEAGDGGEAVAGRPASVRNGTGRTDAAENDEVRLDSVQQVTEDEEVRPLSVQPPETVLEEIRLSSVQSDRESVAGSGQVSRETEAGTAEWDRGPETDKKAQGMGEGPSGRTQNVVRPSAAATTESGAETDRTLGLHETESEFPETVHEIESDFPETVHETKSEFQGNGQGGLHEMESDFPEAVHETKSEIRGDRQERLHETESEFAERTARLLLEGLRRAAAVR